MSMPTTYHALSLMHSFIGRLAALPFPFRHLLHREEAFASSRNTEEARREELTITHPVHAYSHYAVGEIPM